MFSPEVIEFFDKVTFDEHLHAFFHDKDVSYGTYFDYIEFMWSLRDEPNILLLHFEDLKRVSNSHDIFGTDHCRLA